MRQETFDRILHDLERQGRGWVHAEDAPPGCIVLLDGKPLTRVVALHRARGIVRQETRIDKHAKRWLFQTRRGRVTVLMPEPPTPQTTGGVGTHPLPYSSE